MLTCLCCGETIEVFELEFVRQVGFVPKQFTPDRFYCVPCMDPRYWDIYPQCREAVESRRRVIHLPVFDADALDTQERLEVWQAQ